MLPRCLDRTGRKAIVWSRGRKDDRCGYESSVGSDTHLLRSGILTHREDVSQLTSPKTGRWGLNHLRATCNPVHSSRR